MAEPKETAVATQGTLSTNDMVIGVNTDVSNLSIDERVALFQRVSEAQAGIKVSENLLNRELVATSMTLYQRDFVDQETGEIGLASYVAFVLDDGTTFKTASSQAIPFATQTARFIGYDVKTGTLPYPIKFKIVPQKADEGFKYSFVFAGIKQK